MAEYKNFVLFVLDQLSFRALRAYGNEESSTPNIDAFCNEGVTMEACYCPFPLCQPARAAIWTGRFSHRNRVWSNGRKWPITGIDESFPALGEVFTNAGYDAYHFGKKHDGGALRGFVCSEEKEIRIPDENPLFPFNMDSYADEYTVKETLHFLKNRKSDKPLLLVVDLVNPHNICGWVGKNKFAHSDSAFEGMMLPKLLPNYEFNDIGTRPPCVQYLCCSHVRQSQTKGWTERNFREYLAAYYYYLAHVDEQIGMIMDALKNCSINFDNTFFVLTSDHGDNMAARASVTKQVTLYEEVTRVPLVFAGNGVEGKNLTAKGICSSLDIFPTLISLAGIKSIPELDGIDISESFSSGILPERKYVGSEWFTEWGYTVSPGRMIRCGNVKYIHYLEGDSEELYLLDRDPYETHNAVEDQDCKSVLDKMRLLFKQSLEETDDSYLSLEVQVDKRWRSHHLGYQNHEGPSAPEVG